MKKVYSKKILKNQDLADDTNSVKKLKKDWKTYISPGRMAQIIKQWGWKHNEALDNIGKYYVDIYDFNGDGRLNIREFIIAMIRMNKNNYEIYDNFDNTGCSEKIKCLKTIIQKIENIFLYCDCSNEGLLTAKTLFERLKDINISGPTKCNIYNCIIDSGYYRTSAANDFILKAKTKVDGKITKDEFKTAILQGFWDRQVDVLVIVANIKKSKRWRSDGTDIVCDNIQKGIDKK